MNIDMGDTALVAIDPQNDVLSEKGISWSLVGESIEENNTVANIEMLFIAAKERGFRVFISPHYLYPHDQAWKFGGAVEKMMPEKPRVSPSRSLPPRRFHRLLGRLARTLQAPHR